MSEVKSELDLAARKEGFESWDELLDRAHIGHALMEAIFMHSGPGGLLEGWAPATCPSEIVSDLLMRLYCSDETEDA